MMKRQLELLFLLFLLLLHSAELVSGIDVYPDFTSAACDQSTKTDTPNINLTSAFIDSINDGWSIILKEPGCYWLNSSSIINDVANISIVSNRTNPGVYSIRCSENIGLAFHLIRGMVIEGISIDGCGVSSDNLENFSAKINETIDTFYIIPSVTRYAMMLVDCTDVKIKNVVVMNTVGIGIIAINVAGNSSFENISLHDNRAEICYFKKLSDVGSPRTIGGGMYVLYLDYIAQDVAKTSTLTIKHASVYNNSYCQSLPLVDVRFSNTVTTHKIAHVVGSASGIGVTLAQLKYAVDVTVESSVFRNNTGWTGAAATAVQYSGVNNSLIAFHNCSFINNGYDDYRYRPFGVATAHAAMLILKNANNPRLAILSESISSILVANSLFDGNSAKVCANIDISFLEPCLLLRNDDCHVRIVNTMMTNNKGTIAPALCASNAGGEAQFSKVCLELENVTVLSNVVYSPYDNIQFNLFDSSGQFLLNTVNAVFRGNTNFTNNSGVAIICVSTNVYFSGHVVFHRNSANFGGALQLLQQSHIVLNNNTYLEFVENCALYKGGAIYSGDVSVYASLSRTNCFLYFGDDIDVLCNFSSCPNISELNISMRFKDNTASFGGTIFGSTLSDCPWYYSMTMNNDSVIQNVTNGLELLASFQDKFEFSPPLTSSSVVSTNAASLKVQSMSSNVDYAAPSEHYHKVYPGERLWVTMFAYDSFQYRANALLLSASDNPDEVNASLTVSDYWFIHSSDNGTATPVDIVGKQNVSSVIAIFSNISPAMVHINVKLQNCGIGFQYDESSKKCLCSTSGITDHHVICDIENQTLTVADNFWFGPVPQLDNLTLHKTCYYDFCRAGSKTFKPSDIDSQCNVGYNRTGVVCTKCKKGMSVIFGSNRCLKCGYETLFLVPVFAIAGILIIITIAFLDISVAEGYVNGFIFYSNCMNYFLPYLLPDPRSTSYIFVPISWINLDLGIESCFYSGMSELTRVALRLVFPLYLYLLMSFIVVLAKYSKTFARIPFSASRTFATLSVLTYFSIFGTSICIIGVSRLQAKDDNGELKTYYGWAGDVSHPYGQGMHAGLVAIAVILMIVYVLPIPLLLMFPSLLYRFRYTHKLKPILDAFWNPFRPSFRFWLGLRALFRMVSFTLAMYVNYPENVFWFAIIVSAGWFVQERCSPYQGFFRNAIDSFFILNLIVILFSNIFYGQHSDENKSASEHYEILVLAAVFVAYSAFSAIIVVHLIKRFPSLRKYTNKFYSWFKKEKQQSAMPSFTRHVNSDSSEEEKTTEYPSSNPVTFTEFREPLLDGSVNNYDSLKL